MPISVSHIVDALSILGGEAHLDAIVAQVRQIAPKPHPVAFGDIIRARLQERCREAKSYKPGAPDLFASVHGVAARQGVWRLKAADPLSITNPDGMQDGVEADVGTEEGRASLRIHLRRERSRKLIADFKAQLASLECEACGFDFEKVYGPLGSAYIEAHHTIPVADLQEGAKTKLTDLAALCANCHRMVHRNGLMGVTELRAALMQARGAN